jgi:glycosyltransferase involved in cell wall biosynthesis
VIRVTFLVHSLRIGGAEVQLSTLARGLDRREFCPTVVSFYDDGELIGELRKAGITVVTLGMRSRLGFIGFLPRLIQALRDSQPDIIYSFLDFPNVVAAIIKPWLRGSRLIWGIRASDMRLEERNRTWRVIFALERLLAGAADLIICNSWAGRSHLKESRFPTNAIIVVPNGIDTERFCPDPAARSRTRSALGFADDDIVVGLVARLDPMKDHATFLKAAEELTRDLPRARFVCIGHGSDQYAGELRQLEESLSLGNRITWTGARMEVPELLNAFDIATLTSAYGEGFPNAVGEGMATGLPYVTTDVGDAARIVGDAGTVVPIESPSALAAAWRRLAGLSPKERGKIGLLARARVQENFPRKAMVAETSKQLRHLGPRMTKNAAMREII